MKHTPLIMALLSLLVAGCSDPKKKSSSTPSHCQQYPWAQGCMTSNPYNPYMPGTTTGTTTGGTTGGHNYTTIPSDNNWQSLYPDGVPQGTCSSASGTGYDLRKGTITLAGGMMYSPLNPWGTLGDSQYTSIFHTHNNSHFLVSADEAKQFFASDAKLKVRFKIRPQPAVSKSQGTWCLGRQTGMASDPYGYKSLKFNVALRGLNEDGTLKPYFEGTKQVSAGVNSCTPAVDFSGLAQNHPHGVVVVVSDVQSDQSCWYGSDCTAFGQVRTASCWQMDVEVSVDGTKDIN